MREGSEQIAGAIVMTPEEKTAFDAMKEALKETKAK